MFTVPVHTQENPEIGNHVGILSWIVTLGTQQTTSFTGELKDAFKISLGFELPEQIYSKGQQAGQAMLVRNQYNVSTHPNGALRKILEPWLGVFETEEAAKETLETLHRLIGAAALVNISISDSGFANIASLTPPLSSMVVPAATRAPVLFTLESVMWNPTEAQLSAMTEDQYGIYQMCGPMKTVFDNLPEKTKATIAKSPEFIELNGGPLIIPNQPQQRQQAQRAAPGQRPGIVRAGQLVQPQRPIAPAAPQRPVQHVAQPQQAYRQALAQPAAAIQRAVAQPAVRQAAPVAPQRQAFQAPQRQVQPPPDQNEAPFNLPSDDDVPL